MLIILMFPNSHQDGSARLWLCSPGKLWLDVLNSFFASILKYFTDTSTSSSHLSTLLMVVSTADYFGGIEQASGGGQIEDIPQQQEEQQKMTLEVSLVKVSYSVHCPM